MSFNRALYYSQTELHKKYKVSVKAIRTIITENKIPVVQNEVVMRYAGDVGQYKLITKYILITDWLNLYNGL